MKAFLGLFVATILTQIAFAGPFVAGGGGVMSLAYCDAGDGSFGAVANRDIMGDVTGYSWIAGHPSPISKVKVSPAQFPGSPNEKPMSFSGQNFKIEVMLGNLPAQKGAPIERAGKVKIHTKNGTLEKMLNCTLYGI